MDFLPGHHIELLKNGEEFFPALIHAFDGAITEIRLETYIFANDVTGRMIAEALARAAQRGVAVQIMVDGFGAANFVADFGARLRAAGVDMRVFRPEVARFRLRRHRLRRLHRKLVTVDARIAFVGGINIIDDLDTPGQIPPRHDYAVRIEGPLLAPIHGVMEQLWHLVSWASLRQRLPLPKRLMPVTKPCGQIHATFLIRDNLRHRYDIENAYLSAIHAAHDDITIANAYFLPGRRFRQALIAAARRGVRVTLLLQGRVEYRLLHYATQSLYGALLAAGIQIQEYRQGFLHAKVAVIDDRWATVGSSNIDPFSLMLAREANVVIHDSGFASELRASLQQTMAHGAQTIAPIDWRIRALPARLLGWLAYGLVRLMVDVLGYGEKR